MTRILNVRLNGDAREFRNRLLVNQMLGHKSSAGNSSPGEEVRFK